MACVNQCDAHSHCNLGCNAFNGRTQETHTWCEISRHQIIQLRTTIATTPETTSASERSIANGLLG